MPSAMPPVPLLANHTIGEATSLSPGLSIIRSHAYRQGAWEPPRHGIGESRWREPEEPGYGNGMPPGRGLVIPTLRKHARRYD